MMESSEAKGSAAQQNSTAAAKSAAANATNAAKAATRMSTETTTTPAAARGDDAGQGPDRRQSVIDRRAGADRRQMSRDAAGYAGPERRVAERREDTGLERRRGPGRRRTDDRKSAEEGEMTDEQFEFVMAVDTYKRLNNRPFPTWTEVLEVVKQLGYRKVAASTIKLPNNNGRATQ